MLTPCHPRQASFAVQQLTPAQGAGRASGAPSACACPYARRSSVLTALPKKLHTPVSLPPPISTRLAPPPSS